MKKLITLFVISLVTLTSLAQDQHLVDSLEAQLKSLQATKLELGKLTPKANDTTMANILNNLSESYWSNDPDMATDYAQQCLTLSEQINYKKGMANAYNSMGVISRNKGDYLRSLDFHNKALKISEEIGNKKGIAMSYSNIGIIYAMQGNYAEALKNFLATLKIYEETGEIQNQAKLLNNIGRIYIYQGNYTKALENLFDALKMFEEINNISGISLCCGNIGIIYYKQLNFPEALKYYFRSLKIAEEMGDKNKMSGTYNDIGHVYADQGNTTEALKYYFASLKIVNEMDEKNGIAESFNNIGLLYTEQKKYIDASEYLNKALLLSKEIGAINLIQDIYENLAKLDSAQGNFNKALEHYKLCIIYRDSIFNTENAEKTLALQMNYDFGKKQDSLNAVQAQKDLIATNEKNKQRLLRNGFIGGFGLMLLFAGIFFKQRNNIKKGKQQSDELLLNILPSEVAEELKDTGNSKAKNFNEATVMFTDFKDFTNISEQMSPEKLVKEIDTCFSAFDHIIHKHGIEKIKTIGDAYMCAGGLPVANTSHAENVVKAAIEIRDFMTHHNKENLAKGELPFEIRIGINTGPVVAGIVGVRKFAYDIWGDTVNLANRIESSGEPGKVNISESTYKLVKDKFTCVHRGKIQAKNKGEVEMYFVEEQI